MKILSCRFASVVAGLSVFLLTGQLARADIYVESTSSFGNVSIDSSAGSVSFSGMQSSAFAQAGANGQYNSSLGSSSAGATDIPVAGGSATGAGTASAPTLTGSSSATGSISGAAAGFDTSTGRASENGMFDITGVSGRVNVTFSAVISGALNLSANAYGVYGLGETAFSLSVNGQAILFSDLLLTVGPGQSQSGTVSETLTGTMTLQANTDYDLWIESDAEATVLNSGTLSPVPDNGSMMLEGLVMLAVAVFYSRQRHACKAARRAASLLLLGVAAGLAISARASYFGSDATDLCKMCGSPCTRKQAGAISASLCEANLRDDYQVVNVLSAYGPTLPFVLTYNSYNADGSKVQLDTGLGFGWTHTYNALLFQQRGQMFRLDADGRVTQYYMNYSGTAGTYTSAAGYFETLTMQSDGSFTVTNKFQSWWHFGSVPNTPFLVEGPVYRLLQMGDRNNNITTMTYNASGLLATASDPFGRTLQFAYNASGKLSSVTDPLGRTTTLQYDPLARMPIMITDPLGNSVQYTYNSQYQMTRKVDRDGRMYFYMYKSLKPFAVTDSSGQPYFSLVNPGNWAVNPTNLAFNLVRQYIPSTTSSTDGRGNVWQYSYDTNGYITQTTAPDGSTTRYSYDPVTSMVSSITNANGYVTRYQYDANGNRTNMTDALGNVTSYTYEPIYSQLTSITDPNARTTIYTYDLRGNRIQTTDALGQTQSWTYDTHGDVLSATDKRGYTTRYQYDGNGNLVQTTDPLNDVTTYTRDAIGNILSATDANGHTTHYAYDLDDRLIMTVDPLGYTNTTAYDGAGNVLSRTDADGHTTYYAYDLRDRLVATTNALGGITQTAYDLNDNVISRTDEDVHTTTNSYDTLNRLLTTTDPLSNISRTSYDAVGNVISTTDPDGHTTTNGYDALNRRVSVIDPLGYTTTYDYASSGGPACCGATGGSDLVTGIVDGDGKITYFNYDELNRLIQVERKSGGSSTNITPSDAVTTTTYDADNNRITLTDPNDNTTTNSYDALNRLIGTTNAAGDVTITAYDPVGNVAETTDPRGNVTTNIYDADNRLIQESDSVGPVVTESYDPVGNVISSTNGDGNATTAMYDALNRVIDVTDPLGRTTVTAYDAVGNVLSATDRNGSVTTYMYDADNRQIGTTDALGHTSMVTYDPVGNVISTIDPLGHAITFNYDADNRRIEETYADTPSDNRTYMYDAVGHVISRLDQNGQTTTYQYNDFYYMTNLTYSVGPGDQYIYDLGGRVTNATRSTWTNTYTYDGANRPLEAIQDGHTVTYTYNIPTGIRIITYPGGQTVTESNDLRSRLVQVNDMGSPLLTQYTYDQDNNVLVRSNRNGTSAHYSYNANDWVTNLTHTNASTFIAGYAYAYDHEGNRIYQMNQAVPSDSETYTYDALYRLTNYDVGMLSGGVIPSPSIAESYGLDPVGNWTNFTSNTVAQTRTHNAVNEIATITGDLNPLAYDANGNLLDDGHYAYTYDAENRLTAVTRDSDSALVGQYIYDAFGRRVVTVASPAGSSSTNVLFYDGSKIVEEQNSGGTTQATYTYGTYVDEVLTMDRGGQIYYYHPNALYSAEAVTDSSGAVAERYTYDAYGHPAVLDGAYHPLPLNPWGTPHSAISNEYLFTGRQLDEESGLYYYRARYYDCFKGRFLNRDPLVDSARDPLMILVQTMESLGEFIASEDSAFNETFLNNLYAYVLDNPVNLLDPSGLKPTKESGAKAIADTAEKFKALCKDCCACNKPCTVKKCQEEAQKMIDAIVKIWNQNFGRGKNTSKDNVGGYLCWDWSRAFEAAANFVKPQCWTAKEGMVNKNDGSGVVHFFVTFNACNNKADKCTAYLDDSWFDGNFYHTAPWPPAGNWTPGNWKPPADRYTKPGIQTRPAQNKQGK